MREAPLKFLRGRPLPRSMDIRRGYAAACGLVGLAACAVVVRFAAWPVGFRVAGAATVILATALVADAVRRFG